MNHKLNTAKHTPGPWGCISTSDHAHDYRLTKPDGSRLPVNAPYNDHSEQRANANLIAATLEMLAALEGTVSHNAVLKDDYKLPASLMRQIKSAIAKATAE